jgi:hypothetical protein
MADFILSVKTINLDGRRSSGVRKLTVYTLATAGRKLSRKKGRTRGEKRGIDSSCRVADKSMLTYVVYFYTR